MGLLKKLTQLTSQNGKEEVKTESIETQKITYK